MSYGLQFVNSIRRGMQGVLSAVALGASLTAWGASAVAAELPGSFKGDAYGVSANAKAGPIFNTIGRLHTFHWVVTEPMVRFGLTRSTRSPLEPVVIPFELT